MMKCMQCGSTMTTKRENVPYSALPGTVLVDVDVSRCPSCGEYEVAIPAIDELNRQLAEAVIRKKGRLGGPEVRFLRTYLGHSAADFARIIKSNPSTVSRWESDTQPIGQHTDLLLRAMVMLGKKVDAYPVSEFAELADAGAPKTKGPKYVFKIAAKKWRPAKPADARAS